MRLFDIGANIGRYAIANSSSFSQIVSVEASPGTFTKLKSDIASYSHIIPLNYAISDSSADTITFYDCAANTISTLDKDWLTSPSSRFCNYAQFKEILVPTMTLDKLISIYGVPDLLKIDVEGAENIVLASLSQKVPLLCFEWAAEWREKGKECIHHLVRLGYTKFHIQFEDKYTYRPTHFEKSATDALAFFDIARDKRDWGMIWTTACG
jgi:FkbM family methyltransferase